jgi:hypothetical protein
VVHAPTVNPFTILSAWIKRLINRADRRAAAAAVFRESFHRELQGLYPRPTEWPKGTGIEETLRRAFPALQTAYANFRPYVRDKSTFDEAWRDYRCGTKREVDDQCYLHYLNATTTTPNDFGGETVLVNDGRANFKRNVDRLLRFAQVV